MVTTVGSRPSHYEALGLTPEATGDEIAQAFARKMSLFRARPLADVAQVTLAYETLRNPDKRETYDRSIGVLAEPEPEPKPIGWSFTVAQPRWTSFIASPATNASWQATAATAHPSEPHVTAEPGPEAATDPRLASIAASLRELAGPGASEPSAVATAQPQAVAAPGKGEPTLDIRGEELRRAEPRSDAGLEQLIQQIRSEGRAEKERLRDTDDRSIDWKRPALAVGGLVVGVGLLGGLAGVVAGGAARDSVTVAVPAAKPVAKTAVPSTPLAASLIETPPREPVRADATVARARRMRALPQPGFADNELVELSQAGENSPSTIQPADGASAQPAAEVVPASLPLPKAVIARTIDRIGYSCGEVASATQVEGQGAFKITCTSGQTYQAAQVRGRYHFRRWDRR